MWKCLLLSIAAASLTIEYSLSAQALLIPQAARGDEIVVEARRRVVVKSYIRRMVKSEPRRQIARWNMPLCIKYEGMNAQFSLFIQERVKQVARKIGASIANSRCSFNVLVNLTDHADLMAKALAHMRPTRIGSLSNLGLPPHRDIAAIEAPRVIRWMTVTETVSSDGVPIGSAHEDKPFNKAWIDSFIRSTTREDVRSKIVLIDTARLRDVTLDQLADYITFVILAAPDITADFSKTDSIMALFSSKEERSARITEQDWAFLGALYSVPLDRPVDVQADLLLAWMMKTSAKALFRTGE
jgi:hypothetical protein